MAWANLYPGVYYGLVQFILLRPNYTPMIPITISIVLSDIPRPYPFEQEYAQHPLIFRSTFASLDIHK